MNARSPAYAIAASGATAPRQLLANRLTRTSDDTMNTQSALTRKMSLLWRRTKSCMTYS